MQRLLDLVVTRGHAASLPAEVALVVAEAGSSATQIATFADGTGKVLAGGQLDCPADASVGGQLVPMVAGSS